MPSPLAGATPKQSRAAMICGGRIAVRRNPVFSPKLWLADRVEVHVLRDAGVKVWSGTTQHKSLAVLVRQLLMQNYKVEDADFPALAALLETGR